MGRLDPNVGNVKLYGIVATAVSPVKSRKHEGRG
ncbi:hypothetical protein AEGHOMDF_3339 [Methylobacterium soli]|jgi:hypothetical protein|nr:hypothetical protein AEGHOMDF_3339 [Methylobacterium soli]